MSFDSTARPAVASSNPRTGYLPSLDGWRAVAILAVVMDHDEPWTLKHFGVLHSLGGWAVWLFFAISGFLVCSRILEDERVCGHFRVKAFYVRRLFRIQPAALVYVAVIALLTAAGIAHQHYTSLFYAAVLVSNYTYNGQDFTHGWRLVGHFWTLAVEEHFYLLLSLLLLFIKRGRELVFAAIIAVLIGWYVLAPGHFAFYHAEGYLRRSEFNLQYLLSASLFALLLRRPAVHRACERFLHPVVAFAGTLIAMELWNLIFPMPAAGREHFVFSWIAQGGQALFYCFQFWIVATVLHPRSLTTRLLELPPFRFVGRLSYSLYLWHVLFYVSGDPMMHVTNRWLLLLNRRPERYLATFLCAWLSYLYVEKPLIRMGHRLAKPTTPGHRDLQVAVTA